MIINKDFFSQETSEVSKLLLGKVLHFNNKRGVIVETEAYKDHTDPASHACRGKTKRNAPMFGPAGMTYVYLIYGIHHCFNITADQKPGAVLIRSVIDIDTKILVNGPGKVCKHYDINKKHNNLMGKQATKDKPKFLTETMKAKHRDLARTNVGSFLKAYQ